MERNEGSANTARPPGATAARWLRTVALAFAAIGLSVAFAGNSSLFAMWRQAAATDLLGQPAFPSSLATFAGLTFGILGASICAKWLAVAWVAARFHAERQRWQWNTLAFGLLVWFAVDSGISAYLGAWFNIAMINLAPLVGFGLPLLWARRVISPEKAPAPTTQSGAWTALFWICTWFTVVGLVLVVAPTSALFDLYSDAIAASYFGGHAPSIATTWQRFIYALVGGTFAAHFAMLALAVHYAAGQRWVIHATLVSVSAWFAVDVGLSLYHDGLFNVWMVDVPAFATVAVACVVAARHAR